MLMVISVYCVCLFGMNALEYSAWMRYGKNFGYKISSTCQPSSDPEDASYIVPYQAVPVTFDPRTRVLSVLSVHADHSRPLNELRSDTVEVLVLKDSVTRLEINTPNLRSFTVVNTGELMWKTTYFNFPKLRVFNLVVVSFTNRFQITALGSKELEVLRIIKTDHTIIDFDYTAEFSKLRILQFHKEIVYVGTTAHCRRRSSLHHVSGVGFSWITKVASASLDWHHHSCSGWKILRPISSAGRTPTREFFRQRE
ncbi:hypothetical protein AHF37_05161 [Paragonimus kellicotti]|nr:hypothetical protein AHF37_05161 [Paragonimus kellicotti]